VVAVPSARILGGPDLHVDIGSTINLTCLIQFSPEPPAYIFWYHEDEVSGRKVIIPFHSFTLLLDILIWPYNTP
ncbi:jg879, partial [Pararge aegeria aegeria]